MPSTNAICSRCVHAPALVAVAVLLALLLLMLLLLAVLLLLLLLAVLQLLARGCCWLLRAAVNLGPPRGRPSET